MPTNYSNVEIDLLFRNWHQALFAFNVGVEIGQLLFIAVMLALVGSVRRMVAIPRGAVIASAYGIGSVAAFWSLERLNAMFL